MGKESESYTPGYGLVGTWYSTQQGPSVPFSSCFLWWLWLSFGALGIAKEWLWCRGGAVGMWAWLERKRWSRERASPPRSPVLNAAYHSFRSLLAVSFCSCIGHLCNGLQPFPSVGHPLSSPFFPATSGCSPAFPGGLSASLFWLCRCWLRSALYLGQPDSIINVEKLFLEIRSPSFAYRCSPLMVSRIFFFWLYFSSHNLNTWKSWLFLWC